VGSSNFKSSLPLSNGDIPNRDISEQRYEIQVLEGIKDTEKVCSFNCTAKGDQQIIWKAVKLLGCIQIT